MSVSSTRDDRYNGQWLLAVAIIPFIAALTVVRYAAQGWSLDIGLLALSEVITVGSVLAMRERRSTTPGLVLLITLGAIIVGAHGLGSGAPTALIHVGILLVFGSLVLTSRDFRIYTVVMLVLVLLSRCTRIALGNAGPAPAGGSVNLLCAMAAFAAALWILDVRHRTVSDNLERSLEATRAARRTALEARRSKGRFLANMSHELRTPMNAILGYAELVQDDIDESFHQPLQAIREAGAQLLCQIDGALDLAQQDAAEETPLEEDPTPLPPAMWNVESERFVSKWLLGIGSFTVTVSALSASAAVWTSAPLQLDMVVVSAVFGIVVGALGWLRWSWLGVRVFLFGACSILGYAVGFVETAAEVQTFGLFVVAMAAIALPLRSFVGVNLLLGTALAAAGLRRYLVGWSEGVLVTVPVLSLAVSAVGMGAIVWIRGRQLAAMDQELAGAEQARRTAAEADRARDDFVQATSYRMRTPLTTILGFAEMLSEEVPEEFREDIERVGRAGRHLLAIVENIQDLRRMAVGEISFEPCPVPVDELVSGAVELTRRDIEAGGNTLVVAPAPQKVLYGDASQLRQILVNLLSNAGKYTQKGEVRLEYTEVDGVFTFQVRDTGEGIAVDALPRLFVPFERLTQNRSIGGTGLGLTIARQLARMHGGDLTVESELGRGSTFSLEVPIVPTSPLPER